jgi:hypothetical protein
MVATTILTDVILNNSLRTKTRGYLAPKSSTALDNSSMQPQWFYVIGNLAQQRRHSSGGKGLIVDGQAKQT